MSKKEFYVYAVQTRGSEHQIIITDHEMLPTERFNVDSSLPQTTTHCDSSYSFNGTKQQFSYAVSKGGNIANGGSSISLREKGDYLVSWYSESTRRRVTDERQCNITRYWTLPSPILRC